MKTFYLRFVLLVFLLVTQTKIEAEHWLKCLCFVMLKLTNLRWVYGSESGMNLLHVGVLPPYG